MGKKKNKNKAKRPSKGYQIYDTKSRKGADVYGVPCPRCENKFTLTLSEIPTERLIRRKVTCPYTSCQDELTVYYDFKENKRFVYDTDTTIIIDRLTLHERAALTNLLSRHYKASMAVFQKQEVPTQGQAFQLHMFKNLCDKVFAALEEVDKKYEEMRSLDRVLDSDKNRLPEKVAV